MRKSGTALKKACLFTSLLPIDFLPLWTTFIFRAALSEYRTGYRAFTGEALTKLPLSENSNGFISDNEIIAQALFFNFRMGEIAAPSIYHSDSSSIGLGQSSIYGIGVLKTGVKFVLQKTGILRCSLSDTKGKGL